jgi:hypothetical protein
MTVSLIINRSTTFFNDQDEIGVFDPGDVLYTRVTITNNGTSTATGVTIEDSFVNDLNGSVLVANTLNVSPIAFNDTFTAIGNTVLRVGASSGSVATINGGISTFVQGNLLSNDKGSSTVGLGAIAGDTRPGFTIDVVANGTSVNGGRFNIFSDGSFNYVNDGTDVLVNGKLPTDSFTYTIRDVGLDGNPNTADDLTSTATVTIVFAEQTPGGDSHRVWYVDSSAAAGGDGTSARPFNNLSASQINGAGGNGDLDSTGEYIYVKGIHTANFVLEAGQSLIGGGSALVVGGTTLAAAGSQATLRHSGTGVTLSTNNTVSGLNIDGTVDAAIGIADGGGTVGTLNISNVGLNVDALILGHNRGQLIDIDQGGTVNITLNSMMSLGSTGANGGVVQLSGLNGSFTVTGTAFIGGTHSQNGLVVTGGTGAGGMDVALSGNVTIETGAMKAIEFANNGAGSSLTLNGAGVKDIDTSGVDAFAITGNTSSTVSISGGTLDVKTGTAVGGKAIDVSSNNGLTMTVSSNVIASAGTAAAINIQNNTGTNSITFSGASKDIDATVGGTATGINMTGNSAGTSVTFSGGGLDLDTTGGAGIVATGNNAGTLIITGTGNSISTAAGTALNVANTTIGSGGLNFVRIDVNGATQGIILNTTGSTAGLTVAGTGTAGSGGTIQNTGQGAVFTSTSNVSLSNMNFTNANTLEGTVNNVDSSAGNSSATAAINMSNVSTATFNGLNLNGNGTAGGQQLGINGNTVSNFTLSNSQISGFGDEPGEGAMRFWNLSGTSSITNSTFSFASGDVSAGENHIDIRNGAGSLTLNVTGNTFNTTRTSANGSGGIALTTGSNAVMTANIVNNDFFGMKTSGVEVFARDSSTLNVNITNGGTSGNHNVFDRQGGLSRAIGLNAEDTAILRFIVTDNTISGSGGPIINMFSINDAQVMGRINNNTITGGGVGSVGSPIFIHPEDSSNAIIEVKNNVITQVGQDPGIMAISSGDGAGPSADDATLDITIANNTITLTNNAGGTVGIDLRSGPNSADITKTAANVTGNTVNLSASGSDIAFLTRIGSTGSNLYLQGPVVGANNQARATSNWSGNLNSPGTSVFAFDAAGAPAYSNPPPGAPYNGAVRTPTNLSAEAAPPEAVMDGGLIDTPMVDNGDGGGGDTSSGEIPNPPAPAPQASGPVVVDDGVLSQAELDLIVEAAIQRWAAAGATAEQIAAMRAVAVTVSDLGGLTLGVSHAGTITLDDDAGGWRWFVDSTPDEDSEYQGSGTRLHAADANGLAGTRMDLLTVVTHELGHQIGLSDTFDAGERDELMYGTIRAGERRLPGSDDLDGAGSGPVAGAFVVAPLEIGDLPAGQSVIIEWRSTVASPANGGLVGHITGQTTVYGGNFATLQSDHDTLTPLTAEPFIANIDSLSLGNLVFRDKNKNGVFDAGDQGIPNVLLRLYVDSNGNNGWDPGTDLYVGYNELGGGPGYQQGIDTPAAAGTGTPLTAKTDADGLYAFNSLAPGNYIVVIDATNFQPGGALYKHISIPGGADADSNTSDVDDNGYAYDETGDLAWDYIVSEAITLGYGTETHSGPNGSANDTNNTLGFGFEQPNQPPEGANHTVSINEDAQRTLAVSDFPFTDPESNGLLEVVINSVTGGTLAVNGTAVTTFPVTVTAVQLNASQVVFTPTENLNGNGAASLSFQVRDNGGTANGGVDTDESANTLTINIAAVNDPVGTVAPGTASVDEDTPTAITGMSISDPDAALAPNGVYQVTLSSTNGTMTMSTLTGLTFTAGDGTADSTMTFHGTLAAINTALATATYSPAAGYSGPAEIKLEATDEFGGTVATGIGSSTSDSDTIAVTVTEVNDAPVVDLNAGGSGVDANAAYSEDSAPVVLHSGLTVGDVDSASLTGATVAIGAGFMAGADSLTLGALVSGNTGTGGAISFSYDPDTGVMTLSGTASPADYEAALRMVAFSSSSHAPGTSRTISWTATDGSATSDSATTTLTITNSNDAPASTPPTDANISWTEDTAPVPLMQGVVLSDPDLPASFAGGSLTINVSGGQGGINFRPGSLFSVNAGRLIYDDSGTPRDLGAISLIGTTNVAVTGLTSEATTARLNDLVDDFTFFIFGHNPTAGDRTVTMTFNDGGNVGGGALTTVETQTLTVTAVNDAPTVDPNGAAADFDNSVAYTELDAPAVLASGLNLTDPDDTMMEAATVAIGAGFLTGEDSLSLGGLTSGNTGTGGAIAFSYDSATGVMTLTGTASTADYQAALRQVAFSSSSTAPGSSRTIAWTVTDGSANSNQPTTTVDITEINAAPVLSGLESSVTFGEQAVNAAPQLIDTDVSLTDVEGNFDGGTVTVSGLLAEDVVSIRDEGSGAGEIGFDGTSVSYGNVVIGTVSGGSGSTLTVTLNGSATAAAVDALIQNLTYANASDTPTASRTLVVTVTDADGAASSPASVVVDVTAENDGPTNTVPGAQSGTEDQDLTISGISVSDPDSGSGDITVTLSVTKGRLTLSTTSGLTFTTGTGTGDATMTFSGTVAEVNAALSGLVYRGNLNHEGADTLTIETSDNGLSGTGGAATDTDQVAITLADDGIIHGDSGHNVLTGTEQRDIFHVQQGGDDTVNGLGGNDTFYFGGAFTAADTVDGGAGVDSIILDGNYSAGITFGTGTTSNIVDVETISLVSAASTTFDGSAAGSHSYNLTMLDANVAAGGLLKINGFYLRSGEDLTFDGSAELDGRFIILAGLGVDHLTGSSGNDVFVFGHDGRFGASDVVIGGPGYDVVYLRGDYALDFTAPGAGTIVGIESIFLASTTDLKYAAGGDGEFDYSIVWDDAMLATGAFVTVNGSTLGVNETMVFDGSDETGGRFRLFGGASADTLTGGGGHDFLFGGAGGDTLRGNGGADRLLYYQVSDSTPGAGNFDVMLDFQHNLDLIDVSVIDADSTIDGNQAFTFIGSSAFSGAGQLRVELIDAATNRWKVEADVDGGGADFYLEVVVQAGQPLTASDFFL